MKNIYCRFILLAFFAVSCTKKSNTNNSSALPSLATIYSGNYTRVSATTGTFNGSVTSDGGSSIVSKGVCWSSHPTPAISDNKTDNGTGTGSFTANLTGLVPNTNYYLRVYATNGSGTAYSNEISFNSAGGTVTDIDGNVYDTITIGSQVWMKSNLRTTHYNDGTPLQANLNNYNWEATTSGACAVYNNDSSNIATYGLLYNYYAVKNPKLAPAGWHIPTRTELINLLAYLGNGSTTGNMLKEAGTNHWYTNTGATNSTGFTGLPGGERNFDGTYTDLHGIGWFATTTDNSSVSVWTLQLYHLTQTAEILGGDHGWGISVRCIRN